MIKTDYRKDCKYEIDKLTRSLVENSVSRNLTECPIVRNAIWDSIWKPVGQLSGWPIRNLEYASLSPVWGSTLNTITKL